MKTIKRAKDILKKHGLRTLLSQSVRYVRNNANPRELALFILATEHGRYAIRDPFKDIRSLTHTKDPVIVDGGAHTGGVTDEFLQYFPNATIHAIEPNPHLADWLRNDYSGHPAVIIHEVALGSEIDRVEFNIADKPAWSSILIPNNEEAQVNTNINDRVEVKKHRLDDLVSSADIIKLDLQGYEFQALQGSSGILSDTELILTELSFRAVYNDQRTFCEVKSLLNDFGFDLYNIYNPITRNDGYLNSADGLFVKQ